MLVFVLTFVVMLAVPAAAQEIYAAAGDSAAAAEPARTAQPAATTPAATRCTGRRDSRGPVTKQAASETETVIENDLYRITFTNRGAQVKSWILKKFDNDAQNGPLDLVNAGRGEKFGYPLSLWTYDESLRGKLSSALYVASREGKQTSPDHDHVRVCRPGSVGAQDIRFRSHLHRERRNQCYVQRQSGRGAAGLAFGIWQPDDTRVLRRRADRLPVQQEHRALPSLRINLKDQRWRNDSRAVPLGWTDRPSISPPCSFPTIRARSRW